MLGLSLKWPQDQILFPLESAGDSDVSGISHWMCSVISSQFWKHFFAVTEQEMNWFKKTQGKLKYIIQ